MILLPNVFGLDPTGLLFVFGGIELGLLSAVTRSRRFRRAINAKYGRELEAWDYLRQLTEHYNGLSAKAQRRFEGLRNRLNEAKKNYAGLNASFPDLVKDYIRKIDALQMNYIKLLAVQDKYPTIVNKDNPARLRQQIDEIRLDMADDSDKLRQIKQKRIALLQKRIRSYKEAADNRKILDQQLRTIEDMITFFIEQPYADRTRDEVDIIDNLLTETTDLHDTLSEVEDIMRADLTTVPSNGNDIYGQEVRVE